MSWDRGRADVRKGWRGRCRRERERERKGERERGREGERANERKEIEKGVGKKGQKNIRCRRHKRQTEKKTDGHERTNQICMSACVGGRLQKLIARISIEFVWYLHAKAHPVPGIILDRGSLGCSGTTKPVVFVEHA